jgi:quercetin dioxygenase-like cupin family protein
MQLFRRLEQQVEPVSHNPELRKQVIFGDGISGVVPQFATVDLAPGERTAEHAHSDMDEVFYVLSGQLNIKVDGESYECSAGDAVLIKARERHSLANASDSSVLTLLYFGVLEPS